MTKKRSPFGTLSDVKPQQVDFLWDPYIPSGMLTIMEGDPGIGKSYLTMYLAALLSKGGELPDGSRVRPGIVLCLSAEDDAAYTIRPRIDAMGGDPTKIRYLAEYSVFDDDGLQQMRDEVIKTQPALIIVDPLFAFVPSTVDIFKSNEIRKLLKDLSDVAMESDAAMIVVRHLRKSKGEKSIYQGVGSIDTIAAARSALLVGIDPEDPSLRVMTHLKHNLSAKGDSWAYELKVKREGSLPTLVWAGRSKLTADDLTGVSPVNSSAVDDAIEFLKSELAAGARPATSVTRKAQASGHSDRTIDRAKKVLGVRVKKGKDGWNWSLPSP